MAFRDQASEQSAMTTYDREGEALVRRPKPVGTATLLTTVQSCGVLA